MKTFLLSALLLVSSNAFSQSLTADTSYTSDEQGKIEKYWYWASGASAQGEGFTPNSTITVEAKDPNGFSWRTFTGTSDANGNFQIVFNGMKIRSVLGTHTVTATDADNHVATANFEVTINSKEVLNVHSETNEIETSYFYAGGGITVKVDGLLPGAQIKVNLDDPSGNGMEVEPNQQKYADDKGSYTFVLDGNTSVGIPSSEYQIPEIFGVWTVSVIDFSGTSNYGSYNFRLLPDVLGDYCVPTVLYEAQPISYVELGDLSNSSSLTSTDGYEDFTDKTAHVQAGETYTLKLQGKAKWAFNVNTYTAFFDWNGNGILDEEGEVYSIGFLEGSTGEDGQELTYSIKVPENAVNGATRMRILKVNSDSTTALFWPSGACGYYGYGQIEDYTVNIENQSMSTVENQDLKVNIYPNPVSEVLTINAKKAINAYQIYDVNGQLLINKSNVNSSKAEVSLGNIPSGMYLLKVAADGKNQVFKVLKK